jgi:thioredoxin 1
MVFRDGVLLAAQPGVLPAAALDDLIRQAKALDMDEVKKEIASRKATSTPAHEERA